MVLHPGKKAIRALGVAESFRPTAKKSTLAGVVMRTDLLVDGFVFGEATVGGEDATSSVLRMFRKLRRADVNLIMLSGCIISRYNIIDVDELATKSRLPVVCLTYNESGGIEDAIRSHFAHPEGRLKTYRRLGARSPFLLHTGYTAYVRSSQITEADAKKVLDAFTLQGVVPEPIRLARLLARRASALPARV
jgi:endonuclease V-like protein UPF0215 family